MIETITRDFEAIDFYSAKIADYKIDKKEGTLRVNFCRGINCEGLDLESNLLLGKSQCTANFIEVSNLKLEIYEYVDQVRRIDFKDKKEMIIDFKEYTEKDNGELYSFTAILVQSFAVYTSWDIKAASFFLDWSRGI